MTQREALLALLFAVAAACVVVGVALVSSAAAWIVAGVLVAGWGVVVVGDVT